MDKLKTTDTGGFPFVLNDLRFVDDSIREALKGIMNGFLTSGVTAFIISGCDIDESIEGGDTEYTVSEGYIFLDGEIFYVPAHTTTGATSYTAYWDVYNYYDTSGNKTFQDLNSHDTYEKRQVKLYVAETPPAGYMPKDAPNLTTQLKIKLGMSVDEWHEVGNDDGTTTYNSDWEGVTGEGKRKLRYKKNTSGHLIIEGACRNTNATPDDDNHITILPAAYRPENVSNPSTDAIRFCVIKNSAGSYEFVVGSILDTGQVYIEDDSQAQNDQYVFNAIIPID